MSTNFPTSLDSYSTHNTGDVINSSDVNNPQSAIVALETKVGVDGSAVTTTIDYLLKSTSSQDPGHKHTSASLINIVTVPTGSISSYTSLSAPTGFLLCDGSAVSRTTYATLFGVISTTYGAGDGVSTFNIPFSFSLKPNLNSQQFLNLVSASSQYAKKVSPSGLVVTGDLTVMCNFNMTTLISGDLCANTSGGTNSGWNFELIATGAGLKLRALLSQDGSIAVNNDTSILPIVANRWYHGCFTFKASTGVVNFYLDGQFVGTASSGLTGLFNTSGDFSVGAFNNNSVYSNFLNGNIANVQIFGAVLTQSQILFAMNTLSYSTNRKGLWTLNNTYNDSQGSNNLTSSGSPVFINGFCPSQAFLDYIKT